MQSVEEAQVLTSVADGVATVTLNRAAQYNVLSRAMIAALHNTLLDVGERDDVRAVVIAASGRAFCAGHDLREMRANPDQSWQRALFDQCSAMMLAIDALPLPVIAQVQGIATAAGCQLVAACDIAIASDNARFATSGIGLGLFCSTPAVALTRAVAAKHAAELLFTGDFIDAARAAEIGLVNRAVTPDQLAAVTRNIALRIASHSRHAIASGKRLLRQQRNLPLAEAYAAASENMARDMRTNDAQCGIDAFLDKRPTPDWNHS
jgi:enoyl-CoA hydratase/carnithine racemase